MALPVRNSGWIERFDLPLLLVFGEDLHGIKAEFFGFEKGVMHAAGDGEVGAEHHAFRLVDLAFISNTVSPLLSLTVT